MKRWYLTYILLSPSLSLSLSLFPSPIVSRCGYSTNQMAVPGCYGHDVVTVPHPPDSDSVPLEKPLKSSVLVGVACKLSLHVHV